MKNLSPLICLFIILSACSHRPKTNTTSDQNDLTKIDTSYSVVFKDSSDYSSSFIKSIIPNKEFRKLYFDKNLLVLNKSDTAEFPQYIPQNKLVELTGKNEDVKINLSVTRESQSTIKYSFCITTEVLINFQKSGTADLSPYFFLGSEVDEKDDGNSYFSAEYWDPNDSLMTSIRIGIDPENQERLLAKIKCNIKPINIDLESCPTLIENKGSL